MGAHLTSDNIFLKYNFKTTADWKKIFSQNLPVITDTNFFIACFENQVYLPSSIDIIIDQAYKIVVLKSVIKEINKLIQTSKFAENAMKLVEKYALVIDENLISSDLPTQVDDQIIEIAIKLKIFNPIIASGDRGVQKKAKRYKIPILTFKNKNLRVIK
ncbi:MAG: hypothetical protein HeimC3_14490 [Candidatus Heimdallarchaeota archaeon LC_3]|nr:MAG: hypothetical protein HeimC3_14490 [Candidatus Heimdallarchaeota archaeon LC_3]